MRNQFSPFLVICLFGRELLNIRPWKERRAGHAESSFVPAAKELQIFESLKYDSESKVSPSFHPSVFSSSLSVPVGLLSQPATRTFTFFSLAYVRI